MAKPSLGKSSDHASVGATSSSRSSPIMPGPARIRLLQCGRDVSRSLYTRNDAAAEDARDEATVISVPVIILICYTAAIIHLVRREIARRRATHGDMRFFEFLRTVVFRRTRPPLPSPESGRITDTLKLRDTTTFRFIVAKPRQHPRTQVSSPERRSPSIEEVPRDEVTSLPNPSARHRPSSQAPSSSHSDPFSDTHNVCEPIRAPPSAILRTETSTADEELSLYQWSSAASSYNLAAPDSPASYAPQENANASTSSRASIISQSRISVAPSFVSPSTEADDLEYFSDTTASTLPPSYRSRRPNIPNLKQYPLPGSTPSISSFADSVAPPPSAFVAGGRRRSNMHGPRPRSRARQIGGRAAPERRVLDHGSTSVAAPSEGGGAPSSSATSERRKSVDGGIRLAGGPLNMPPSEDIRVVGGEDLSELPAYESTSSGSSSQRLTASVKS
ncbi:hypothetical protein OH77DRAFT_1155972 [Trametes cingulata]|nr:hypothetical protein OH77DRAFT_1155972 [Trametes cingulata]